MVSLVPVPLLPGLLRPGLLSLSLLVKPGPEPVGVKTKVLEKIKQEKKLVNTHIKVQAKCIFFFEVCIVTIMSK
jgi:hypothetical protein